MLGLETLLLMMTCLLSLLEVAVMELVLWAQAPTLFPLFPSPCLERIHVDWDWRPSLEGAVFGYAKGRPGPHAISPELWQTISKNRKEAAIREYERDLAAATVAAVATFVPDGVVSTQVAPPARPTYTDDSDVPRLPREFESSVPEPHRDKSVWHPPGCIARRLSTKEMNSWPRAREALDAWLVYTSDAADEKSGRGIW